MDKSSDNKQRLNMVTSIAMIIITSKSCLTRKQHLSCTKKRIIHSSLLSTHIQVKKYKSVCRNICIHILYTIEGIKISLIFNYTAQLRTITSNCSLSLRGGGGMWYLSIGGQLKKPVHSSVKCSENITAHQQQLSELPRHLPYQRRKCISGCSPTHDDI